MTTLTKTKTCACGKEFIQRSTLQKHCSWTCALLYKEDTKTRVKIKKCANCGKEFIPYNSMQKYCSWSCIRANSKFVSSNKIQKQEHTLKELEAKAVELFNKFIKLRDTNKFGWGLCIVTGQKVKYGTLGANAGHFYSAAKFPNLRFNEDNVHLQSRENNFYDYEFTATYRINLVKKIKGDAVLNLDYQAASYRKSQYFKPDKEYYQTIIDHYQPLVNKMLAEKEL